VTRVERIIVIEEPWKELIDELKRELARRSE